MPVQAQIHHQPHELGILLPQLTHFRYTHPGMLFLSVVKSGFAYSHLPADRGNRFGATCCLFQRVDDAVRRISALLHFLGWLGASYRNSSSFQPFRFSGRHQYHCNEMRTLQFIAPWFQSDGKEMEYRISQPHIGATFLERSTSARMGTPSV